MTYTALTGIAVMINQFPAYRFFPVLLLCLLHVGCVVSVEENLILKEANQLNKLSNELIGKNDLIIHSERIHFYLRRWDNLLVKYTGESSLSCDNDILAITNNHLYIIENYYAIQEKHILEWCSKDTGSSILRPYKVYKYPLEAINKIEVLYYHKDMVSQTPATFAVSFSGATINPKRIYFTVQDPRYTTPSERIAISKARYKAINKSGEIPLISVTENCRASVADKAHICSAPVGNDGPFFQCESATGHFFRDKETWHLFVKEGWHWKYPVFEIPHQWCCKFPVHIPDCPSDIDLWSSDKGVATTMAGANDAHVLYIGDERNDGSCEHKTYGYWSYKEYMIQDCEASWYRVGGRKAGPCKGMNGTKVRRYVVGSHNCFLYDKVDNLITIDEYYGRQ